MSQEEPKEVDVLQGIIPGVTDPELVMSRSQFMRFNALVDPQNGSTTAQRYGTHPASTFSLRPVHMVSPMLSQLFTVLHDSTAEIATISRSNWQKSATFADDACSGAVTALAMSVNGVYLASASKAGLFIWATQNRRLMYRSVGLVSSPSQTTPQLVKIGFRARSARQSHKWHGAQATTSLRGLIATAC